MKQYLLILLFFMFCTSHQSLAATKPDYSELASEWLAVLNGKDLKQIEEFVTTNFALATLANWDGAGKDRYIEYSMNEALFHDELRLISSKLDKVNARTRHVSKVYSKNTDMQYDLIINFNDEKTRVVTGWYLAAAPKSIEHTSLTESEVIDELKRYSEQLAHNGVFSGTLLFAKGDDILFSAAHGLASHRYDVKNNINTKFQIGSMNKMFTSVAILQLVEAGKVSLNDPLTKFVGKNLLGKGDFENVKIKHLLSHTSGIGNMSGFDEVQNKVRSLGDIQHLYNTIETAFEPGSQWRYSNTGMMLLGQVIESVTGDDYFDYIDKNIYQRADMQQSGSFDLDIPVKNTARSYWFSTKTAQLTENLMFQSVKGLPAGGGYSTVGDLHKFAKAMLNAQLLSQPLSQSAIEAKPELNAPNWGYGFSVRNSNSGKVVGHVGAHLGMTARLNIYQDKGYIFVVLGNFQEAAWPIVAKVDQLMALIEKKS